MAMHRLPPFAEIGDPVSPAKGRQLEAQLPVASGLASPGIALGTCRA